MHNPDPGSSASLWVATVIDSLRMATVTASLGPVGPLLRSLTTPPEGVSELKIQSLTRDLEILCVSLMDHSEAEEPSSTAMSWMSEIRELCYDIKNYFDDAPFILKQHDHAQLTSEEKKKNAQLEFMLLVDQAKHASERREMYDIELLNINKVEFLSVGRRRRRLPALLIDPGLMDTLAKKLMGPTEDKQLKVVVSLVGLEGVGKTTLAKRLYHQIGGQFQCRAFVRVSPNPDMRMLLTSIFKQIQLRCLSEPACCLDAQHLIKNIKHYLEDKRYLIIIDDLWSISVWDIIRRAFPDDVRGSRIIVTTQFEDVASACCSYKPEYMCKMEPLKDDQSQKLLFSMIFGSEDHVGCPKGFTSVSVEIVRKCGRLPLLTVNVASLLPTPIAINLQQWEDIRDSLPPTLMRNPSSDGIKEFINLLYTDLSPEVKTCLLYLAMYPEGCTVDKHDLVKQWVSEGFTGEGQNKEETALDYFDELVSRGMIQAVDINYGEVLSCTLHHMVHDLIVKKSMEGNFVIGVDNFQTAVWLPDKVRRLSVQFGGARSARLPAGISLSEVRSLSYFGFYGCADFIEKCKLLRILTLHVWADDCVHQSEEERPGISPSEGRKVLTYDLSGISKLLPLRYLKVACNVDVKLPDEIEGLQYLETLEVDGATVVAIPSDIGRLSRLSSLKIAVRELSRQDICILQALPELSALSLHVWTTPTEMIVFNKGEFLVLKYFKFRCSVPCLKFEAGSMPDLQYLNLCFNAREAYGQGIVPIGIEHLSGLKEITANIWGGVHDYVGTTFRPAISNHPSNPIIDIQFVDYIFDTHTGEDENKQATDSRMSTSAWSSWCVPIPGAAKEHKLKIEKGSIEVRAHTSAYGPEDMANRMSKLKREIGDHEKVEDLDGLEDMEIQPQMASSPMNKQTDINYQPAGLEDERKQADIRIYTSQGSSPRMPDSGYCGNKGTEVARSGSRQDEKTKADIRFWREPMTGVGEMIVSAVVKQITSRLIKIAGDEISLQWKFKGEVDKIAEQMKYLAAVMDDADDKVRRGGSHGETVGLWLMKLKSVSYDLEDLLDDLDTTNNKAKLKVFISRHNQAYRWITRPHNLEKVGKRIEEIKNESKTFNLDPEARVEQSRKNETFSAISGGDTSTGMQGRSAEKEKIINLILQSRANERMSIIPIVGLGGIGKTTLARSVFADKRVNIFDIQAWVHVSDKFDLRKIVRTIIRSIDTNINLDSNDLEFLHDVLRGKLAGKRYLIVLDDFWEEDGDNLEELKRMLQHGSNGSRIIVTTRKQCVVKTMTTGYLANQRVILPVHESDHINMGVLSTDDCWELIKIRAFGPDDDQSPLKQIGYEIASKCGGIPLVANAFGKVMSEDKSVRAWQNIKVSMDNLDSRYIHQKDTLESLKLSYYFMKLEFKMCFTYLATFPKGFIIDTNRLIQQWNALGYIYPEHDGKRCIDYLLGMSFLQTSGPPLASQSPAHSHASGKLTMHDLVHDLASAITGAEFLVLDAKAIEPRILKKAIHCRHAELIRYENQSKIFEHLPGKLRSLHLRDSQKWQLPPKAFSRSKYMRVLDLACSVGKLSEGQSTSSNIRLPRSIKQMKLLRYLDATGLPVSSLSKSVHTLQHMETLILSNCSLEALPDNVCSLYKLCYLDLSANRSLNNLPMSLGKLSKLSFLNLSGCSVLQEVPKSICQLTCLQHLDMSDCGAIQNLPDKFGSLPNILFLNLSGCSKLTKLPDSVNLESLDHLDLSSCHELENLPQDFGNLQNLVFLSLADCYKVSVLPESFCQLVHLKKLDLSDCHGLRELPDCFGNLSELDCLSLTSCSKLQELPESFSKLSKLRQLNLSYCPRLGKFPSSLCHLKLELLDISYSVFRDLPDSICGMTGLTQHEILPALEEVAEKAHRIRKRLNLPGWITHEVEKIENEGCSSIVKLAELTCYQLQVARLENVMHPEDAERAKLRDKTDLRMLYLGWTLQGEEGKSVLERLIPPRTLEQFYLDGYMSKDFPSWMSDVSSYLPNLTFLGLNGVGSCENLPPFGRLPNLRSLVLENMPNLKKIGKEFYGEADGTCMKLRTITLRSMENLVEWWTTLSGENHEESLIPNLHNLDLTDCPKLKFVPYPPKSMMWRLNNSNMVLPNGGFGDLSSSVLPFTIVVQNCNFSLDNWDRIQHLPTLEIFVIESCNGLMAFPEGFRCLTSLKKLQLWSLKDLQTLPEWLGNLPSLEGISIKDCPLLSSLPASLEKLTTLRELWVEHCHGLEVLPEGLGQLISLQELNIFLCKKLTCLPKSIEKLSKLEKLHIWGCPSLFERFQWEDAKMISQIPNIQFDDYRASVMMDVVRGLTGLVLTSGEDGALIRIPVASTFGDAGASTSGDPQASTSGEARASTSGDAGASTTANARGSTYGDAGASTSRDSVTNTEAARFVFTSGDAGARTYGDAGASTDSGVSTDSEL